MKNLFVFTVVLMFSSCTNILEMKGLSDEVEVLRDNFGINHIYANNQKDLFFMQGYLAAKDRLFQFEIWRRQATGTTAEIFGEEELERDIGTRLFKFRGNIVDELNHYHEDGFEIVSSFVSGINTYIDEINEAPGQLPIEFKLLGIIPKKWTNEDVISRHQGLLGNIEEELNIGRAVSLVGEDKVKELLWFHPKEPNIELDKSLTYQDLKQDILRLYNAFREPIEFKIDYVLENYQSKNTLAFKNDYQVIDDIYSIGSNNWAISGDKSFNGFPLLANDPHRSLSNPSLRYIAHLVAPGWNVIGGGEPEIPGISIGHNGIGAWGLTVFRTDAEDLYIYDINPKNNNQYKHKNEWINFKIINDSIKVKNTEDVNVELLYTIHGPVTFIDKKRNKAYAVRNGWSEIGGSPYLASLRMDQAKNWEEYRKACNYFNIPGENMVWADKYGDIGWQAVGIAPIRQNHSGLVPVKGDGRFEWQDYLPIIDKPSLFNPDKGYISTANQNVTPDDYNIWEAIGYDWSDPYRGNRINNFLDSKEKFDMQDMIDLQVDYYSIPSEQIIKIASELIINNNNYFEKLKKWNNILDKNSTEAGIYIEWQNQIHHNFIEEFVPDEIRKYIDVQIYRIIEIITNMNDEAKSKFLNKTFDSAIKNLINKYGENINNWTYGQDDYKHVKIYHPLEMVVNDSIRSIIELEKYPRGGDGYTPGSTSNSLNQESGGSFRVVINTGDWDNSFATNSPGQSGNPNSKFYKNLYEDWAKDNFFPLLYTKNKILMNLSNRKVYRPTN